MMMFVTSWKVLKRRLCNRLFITFCFGGGWFGFAASSSVLEGIFSKTYPSFLTLKEGSTSHLGLLPLREEEGNRPTRCSEPLRSKVGGASKPCARLCGMVPPGQNWREMALFDTFKYVWIVYLWFRDSLFSFWGNS